jgi:lipopolysaccharide/colanic/teichoic acid biosynthesis glycosyltransferase
MIVKFRTMHVNDGSGPRVTSSSDPRVTREGRWLRKTKLDETPQLINVLKGEMALVGPRPEDPRYVAQYSRAQREILNYKPGLVGPAVLAFRHEEEILAEAPDLERAYLETILPQKLALDLGYMKERTLRSDLRMLGRTVKVVFSRRDAI